MRFRILLALPLAAMVAPVRAQAPLNPPPPLVERAPEAGVSAGGRMLDLVAAQRAQELGFPSAAAAIYRSFLEEPERAGVNREAVTLGLATALLDQGQGAEAERVLESLSGPRGAAWHLRRGLSAVQQNFITTARNQRDASRIGELSAADRGWHFFLQGMIATAENEHGKAVILFNQAIEAAVSPLARARFMMKREQARLRGGEAVSEMQLEATRRSLEQYEGRRVGYDLARTYAAMLHTVGRRADAVAVLQRQLVSLPAEARGEIDDMRLLLGLIAGAGDGAGRNALERLLERGSDRDKQRIALQLLAQASTGGPQLAAFRRQLDGLIAATPAHPMQEDLLLFRAQVALAGARAGQAGGGYAQAEDDARTLLQKFPGTPWKAQAYGVLTAAAWEQRRYRTAADNAVRARAELPAGAERAALGLLAAEAWFRARDFRSAADAYAAVLNELPAGVAPGELLFQRVLAEIEAGSPDAAAALLDELARDPAFDQVNRWQVEWNLARALQAQGQTGEALTRVSRLLAGEGAGRAGLPAELRARMVWMQARLAAAAGQPEQTLQLVEGFATVLEGVPPALRAEITSLGALLRAESNFALGRDAQALEILNRLRAEFPRSDAAVHSYFDEAEHYAKKDEAVRAQQLLMKLAEDFPDNAYAPFALFQAALQAERRGQDSNFVEANRLIEDLVQKYPGSELVFPARLKQGDLLRKRNDFPAAQRVYEELVNKFPQRRDVALAQLALAETHNAQSANEPAHAESAMVLFEHVRDRVDAPLDARVEAGFNLGYLRMRRNEGARAETVWWRDVVSEFLLQPEPAARLGDRGRYWMTRTLLELGALYEQQGKLEQAKEAWLLVVKSKLGYGETLAQARLARFNLAEAKP